MASTAPRASSDSNPEDIARIWPHGDRYMQRDVSGHGRVRAEAAAWVVPGHGDILEIDDATFRFRLMVQP